MRSGLANVTPVLGFVLPSPPTPPSNALACGIGVDGSIGVVMVMGRRNADWRMRLKCCRVCKFDERFWLWLACSMLFGFASLRVLILVGV